MKIVFWSNYPESGVTSNMTAIGVVMSLMYRGRIMMMANHYNQKSLGRTLLGTVYDGMLREECNYFAKGSTHYYVKQMLSHTNQKQGAASSLEVADDGLFYYVQSVLFSNEVYELKFNEEVTEILDCLDQHVEYIFIDTKSQESLSTKMLLDTADIVVVNLRQEEIAVKNFFKRYSALIGKCVFVISAYQKANPYIKRTFVREHKIHPARVAVIPHNIEFQAQCLDGRIVDYVSKHINCRKGAKQYEYIQCLKNAARMLMGLIDEKLILSGEKGGICADG